MFENEQNFAKMQIPSQNNKRFVNWIFAYIKMCMLLFQKSIKKNEQHKFTVNWKTEIGISETGRTKRFVFLHAKDWKN